MCHMYHDMSRAGNAHWASLVVAAHQCEPGKLTDSAMDHYWIYYHLLCWVGNDDYSETF